MANILIIEDEAVIRNPLRRLLERNGFDVTDASSVEEAEESGKLADFDLIIADLRLPGAPGTEAIRLAGEVPVIIMTSYASVKSAVDAMKQGAIDYIAKPFDHDEMVLTVRRALKESRLQRQNDALKADLHRRYPVSGIVGTSQPMRAVFDRIEKVAPTDTTVLILGESGTGKELVARAVHENSQRQNAPLIAVNCAAIPENLIEAELFGHEKGAFTGAANARKGLVESADGGTLFLDEIGELPMPAQSRLLRVLQENEIRRVGSSQARKVDVRLVAATHRDLAKLVQANQFREDLFFRIHVMEINLPPLRDRGEDIIELARYMLNKTCQQLNKPVMRFSDDALRSIRGYRWPGNVRELENVIERAVILADNSTISADLLNLGDTPATLSEAEPGPPNLSLEDYFRSFVLENQERMTETELARQLGISRKALWEKRQRLGIPRERK